MTKVSPPLADAPPVLESLQQFLFEVPLYAHYSLGQNRNRVAELYGHKELRVDGHCPGCGRDATFEVIAARIPAGDPWNRIESRWADDNLSIRCTRDGAHTVQYWFEIKNMIVQKFGQLPSLADIANDEFKQYRKLLSPALASEFHKAVGLVAHGVGVGSFVYLRRIFESLIDNRFEEFKEAEKWDEADFKKLRMEEKVLLLRKHLPEFLVANRKLYSILSIEIHELSEAACLTYFDVMRRSIIMILEDDKKAREDAEQRKAFERAIADFKTPKGN